MGFLLDKLKPEKEIASLEDFNTDSPLFKPFAILQGEQLDRFARGLLKGCHSLYNEMYAKTGNASFTQKRTKGSTIYRMQKGFTETCLAAFEALMCGMFPCGDDIPCSLLDFGQGKFFDENGYVVRYLKEEPLYERSHSRYEDGSYANDAGIS